MIRLFVGAGREHLAGWLAALLSMTSALSEAGRRDTAFCGEVDGDDGRGELLVDAVVSGPH